MELKFVKKIGSEIRDCFEDLAHLRITVFRDFPYLYEGTVDYEKSYLETYANSDRAILFAVYDNDKMIGATTAIPLTDETDEVQAPFIEQNFDIERLFYFGESILLKPYRSLGLGHRFMDERENHAKSFEQYTHTTFCSVVRNEDHPLRPNDYRSNDVFWSKRQYVQQPQLTTNFDWPDIGEIASTPKTMIYWMKPL